jgi:formylglycine-generating enzyme required for sulfatase activity
LLAVGIALAVLAALASTLLSPVAPSAAPTDASPDAGESAPAVAETVEVSLSPTLTDEWGREMVLIPSGEFQMGSENGSTDEQPVHSIYLDAFYIDAYEVLNVDFATFLNENSDQADSFSEWARIDQEWFQVHDEGSGWHAVSDYEYYPVVGVTWFGAAAYCEWRETRLPTEAEWQKAARGGREGSEYPWGDEAPTCAQGEPSDATFADCDSGLVEAGNAAFNGFGLRDVAGNAWEWVADWYSAEYYAESPSDNPTGPETGDVRGMRGGGWNATAGQLRVALRERSVPEQSSDYLGLRCAKTP